MADVRALLAAERQSRRISHPHLSYTKSGMLMCNVCNLNVKSEALWEGHLRSANHRKNVAAQASRQASVDANTGKGVKRKIEDVDEVQEERDETDIDTRKKPKSRPESTIEEDQEERTQAGPVPDPEEHAGQEAEQLAAPMPTADNAAPTNGTSVAAPTVDEDEWAAFEREVAPLAAEKPDYSSATITAAPVTADQLKAKEEDDRRHRLETEADDEKEDEERRLEEEFDVMEEMEERVRKLREKRDALRSAVKPGDDTGQVLPRVESDTVEEGMVLKETDAIVENDEDEEEDEDDWYS